MRDDRGSLAQQYRLAVRDQVRVAYGAVPVILEGLSADDPFRTMIRDRARSWLVKSGALAVEELDTVPLTDAITTALRRLRA